MRITPKQQLITWSVSGILLVLIGAWFTFFSLRNDLKAKSEKILEARITNEINNRQQQNLSALKNQVNQILKDTETLNAAFFDRNKTLDFLKYIENLAATNQLTLDEPQLNAPARVSPDTPSTYSVEEKSFHFEVHGKVPSLMQFLQTLETNPAYILIQTVDIRKATAAEDSSLAVEGIIPWH